MFLILCSKNILKCIMRYYWNKTEISSLPLANKFRKAPSDIFGLYVLYALSALLVCRLHAVLPSTFCFCTKPCIPYSTIILHFRNKQCQAIEMQGEVSLQALSFLGAIKKKIGRLLFSNQQPKKITFFIFNVNSVLP